jgi:hypothetical protein
MRRQRSSRDDHRKGYCRRPGVLAKATLILLLSLAMRMSIGSPSAPTALRASMINGSAFGLLGLISAANRWRSEEGREEAPAAGDNL